MHLMKRHNTLPLLVLAPFVLLWAGCSSNQPADHDQMDHGAMDHSEMGEAANGGAAMATDDGAKPYPLTTCVVSGEKLGEMGEPVTLVHAGRELKFCCADCVKDFQADPDKFMAKLARETAAPQPMPVPADGGSNHAGHQH